MDGEGNTALMYGASGGFTTVVRELMAAGAQIHLANAHGQTAEGFAKAGNYVDIQMLVRSVNKENVVQETNV